MCASEKQKDYWLGMLAAINRINPVTYLDDKSMNKLIGVVPFGLDNKEPIKTKDVLKGRWPGIGKEDKVIIWGGGIWNWFDPLTLIEAINIICKQRQDVKLFFMGIGHPNGVSDTTTANECISLAKKYNLYDKNIFFNDWVEYTERQNYLLEADIGISTYINNLETRFSFRTRVLDYLWCNLPMILTEGDFMSELVSSSNLGLIHKEKDSEELALKIAKLLDDKGLNEQVKDNINKIKSQYKWENVVGSLIEFCKNPYLSKDKSSKVNIIYSSKLIVKIKYYYFRIKSKLRKLFK
jgi:glycosyltransferase involved in cell wall biosynthesis